MKIFNRIEKYVVCIALGVVVILVSMPLLRSGFFVIHDSLQVLRLSEMNQCFINGQLPCRWVSHLGQGYGFPLFNYFAPGFYYLAQIFILVGITFIDSVKIMIISGFVISGLSMFSLAKEFWGKNGGLVSAVLYLLAPYQALEAYVRGDFSEFWSLSLLPLILLLIYRLLKLGLLRDFFFLTIALFIFAITHNITLIISLPLIVLWTVYWVIFNKKVGLKNLWLIISTAILSFGMAAFFLIPAWFEKPLVQTENLTKGYFNYQVHFVSLKQIFVDRFWDYGISTEGLGDTISFQIGIIHWLLVIISLIASVFLFKKNKADSLLVIFLTFIGLGYLFMTNNRSIFIWQNIPVISYVQFPWRFLGIVAILFSMISGFVFKAIYDKNKQFALIFTSITILTVLIFNVSYFQPKNYLNVNDDYFLKGENFKKEQFGSLTDFLPKTVKSIPVMNPDEIFVATGSASIKNFEKKSDYFIFNIEVYDNKPAEIIIPVFNFPEWDIYMDSNIKLDQLSNVNGLLSVNVQDGKHEITGWLRNTNSRLIGNGISLVSFAVFILFLALYDPKNNKPV